MGVPRGIIIQFRMGIFHELNHPANSGDPHFPSWKLSERCHGLENLSGRPAEGPALFTHGGFHQWGYPQFAGWFMENLNLKLGWFICRKTPPWIFRTPLNLGKIYGVFLGHHVRWRRMLMKFLGPLHGRRLAAVSSPSFPLANCDSMSDEKWSPGWFGIPTSLVHIFTCSFQSLSNGWNGMSSCWSCWSWASLHVAIPICKHSATNNWKLDTMSFFRPQQWHFSVFHRHFPVGFLLRHLRPLLELPGNDRQGGPP